MNKLKIISTLLLPLSLISCAQNYQPSSTNINTKLNTFGAGTKWICINNEIKNLKSDSTHYATIPTGERITVGTNFRSNDGYVTVSCSPRSSFIPQGNTNYYLDFEIENEKCTSLVYKEDSNNRVGLAFEPTLKPSIECRH